MAKGDKKPAPAASGSGSQQQPAAAKKAASDSQKKPKEVVSRKAKVAAPPEAVIGPSTSAKSSSAKDSKKKAPAAAAPAPVAEPAAPKAASKKAAPAPAAKAAPSAKAAKAPAAVAAAKAEVSKPAKAASAKAVTKGKAAAKTAVAAEPAGKKKKKELPKRAKVAPLPDVIAQGKNPPVVGKQGVKRPAAEKVQIVKKRKVDPMIVKRPKNFGIGGTVQPKRDLTRFVKWPEYIKVQRQRAVLYKRLKIPPSINQFRSPNFGKQSVTQVFKLLHSYRPESADAKKLRIRKLAAAKASGEKVPAASRPPRLIFGANDVTTAIEKKKAKLVVIAADCDPIEIVLHLPALCRKMGIPYCVIKGGRARLGHLVHRKTTSCVAIGKVLPEHQTKLRKVVEVVSKAFNEKSDEIRRSWGGGILGAKSKARKARLDKARAKELSQKVAASVAV